MQSITPMFYRLWQQLATAIPVYWQWCEMLLYTHTHTQPHEMPAHSRTYSQGDTQRACIFWRNQANRTGDVGFLREKAPGISQDDSHGCLTGVTWWAAGTIDTTGPNQPITHNLISLHGATGNITNKRQLSRHTIVYSLIALHNARPWSTVTNGLPVFTTGLNTHTTTDMTFPDNVTHFCPSGMASVKSAWHNFDR